MNSMQLSGAKLFFKEMKQSLKKDDPRRKRKINLMLKLAMAIRFKDTIKAMEAITLFGYLLKSEQFEKESL